MFPGSSSFNPFPYSHPTMFKEPNKSEENPNHNSPFLFSPFSNSLLTQNHGLLETHFISQSLDNFVDLNTTKEKSPRTRQKRKYDGGENPNPEPNPRKRTGKSDRHSKIYTEKGPRDRRMRLSVPIARKFFDLQDILGFDKASKTIEWLFCQSKNAIEELTLSNCVNTLDSVFKFGEKNDGELGKVVQPSEANESKANSRVIMDRPREISKDIGSFEGNPKMFEEFEFFRSHLGEIDFPLQEVGMIENFVGAASSSASNSIFDFHKDFSMSEGVDSSNTLAGIFENWDAIPWAGNDVEEQNLNFDSLNEFHSRFP